MIYYTVVIEDKYGNEVKGTIESYTILQIDQLVRIKNYRNTYTSGFILNIIGEKDGALR